MATNAHALEDGEGQPLLEDNEVGRHVRDPELDVYNWLLGLGGGKSGLWRDIWLRRGGYVAAVFALFITSTILQPSIWDGLTPKCTNGTSIEPGRQLQDSSCTYEACERCQWSHTVRARANAWSNMSYLAAGVFTWDAQAVLPMSRGAMTFIILVHSAASFCYHASCTHEMNTPDAILMFYCFFMPAVYFWSLMAANCLGRFSPLAPKLLDAGLAIFWPVHLLLSWVRYSVYGVRWYTFSVGGFFQDVGAWSAVLFLSGVFATGFFKFQNDSKGISELLTAFALALIGVSGVFVDRLRLLPCDPESAFQGIGMMHVFTGAALYVGLRYRAFEPLVPKTMEAQ